MNHRDFIEDPVDLADALNEYDDPIYTNHPVAIKPSLYYEFEEFLTTNSSPQFHKTFPCYLSMYAHYMGSLRSLNIFYWIFLINSPKYVYKRCGVYHMTIQ